MAAPGLLTWLHLTSIHALALVQHPHTAEDLADLPDDIVKISSPWAMPKERVVEEAAGEWWGASCAHFGMVCAAAGSSWVEKEGPRPAAVAGVAVFAGVMLRAGGLADSAEKTCRWLDEAGNPWPDLVDNHGNTWSKEEAEALIQSGSMVPAHLALIP